MTASKSFIEELRFSVFSGWVLSANEAGTSCG